jgi:Flp pilus assembly protein TadG
MIEMTPAPARESSRGQILIIFAFLLTILIGFSAFVVDLAWIWTNELKVQRAADAAALAGVVNLPGQVTAARSDAFDESRKNGYRNGVSGVTVNPRQDPDNPRRMVVTVSAPVDTFFMGIFGFDQVRVTRTAKADFVLPVPMGSPLNYYGVGDFRTMVAGTATNTGDRAATITHSPNGWTSPNGALADGGSTHANNATGAQQGYGNFGFSVPAGSTISGIEVRVKARSTDTSGCSIGVQLSWNDGTNWSAQKTTSLNGSFPSSPYPVIGGAGDLWGRTWTTAELANGSFVLRVTDVDPGSNCTDSARTDLDFLTVKVYYTGPPTEQSSQIVGANGSPLCGQPNCSQGFWGAIEGQGSNRSTGDAYATGLNGSGANADYDASGYHYTIEMPSGGTIYIFDPTFCATSTAPIGGHYGAGDHWLGNAEPVSTYFRLWNTHGSPVRSTHTLVTETTSLFQDESGADLITGNDFSDGGEPTSPTNCSTGAITNPGVGGYWHNKWWPMATVAAGTYRLQVATTHPTQASRNASESFENMWSILAQGANAKIYGSGRMVSYANIAGGGQTFYLARIDRQAGAGKTVQIRLFDPGDVGQKAWMQILSPDGNSYNPVTFSYTADNGRSGTNVTCIQTFGGSGPSPPAGCPNATSGGTFYQNSWITIDVPLAANYGIGGLTPAGEIEDGWWKIRYTVNDGNDTTTWEVTIRGNPVRLVVP